MRNPDSPSASPRITWCAGLLLAFAVPAAPALVLLTTPAALADGGEESEESEEAANGGESGRDKESKVRVFTNDDLKKYRLRARETRGDGTLVVDTTPEAPEPPPAAALTPAEKARRKAELDAQVQQAEERLLAIAARRRSLRNPFLPRPQLSEEEQMASAGKDAVAQLEMLDKEEAQLRARLQQLREELAALAKMPVQPAGDSGAGPASGPTSGTTPQP